MQLKSIRLQLLAMLIPMALGLGFSLGACQDSSGDSGQGGDTAEDDAEQPRDVSEDDVGAADTASGDGVNPQDAMAPDGTADTTEDTSGPCDTFGCACNENVDCLNGLCVDSVDGRVCTDTCITECPSDDFLCIPIALGGSDPFNACVPKFPNLCKPCRENADCRNTLRAGQASLCVPASDPREGSFCAAECDAGGTCPSGFVCGDVTLAGGGTSKQCLPDDGMCECRPAWSNLGLVTDCTTENAFGACGGTRTCGIDGLTTCGPAVPAAETCNRGDDDCNGSTDDIPAVTCDITNGFGTCAGQTGCDETGAEICEGSAPAAEACNGLDDNCSGAPDEGTCDDSLICTDNVCGGANRACTNPIKADSCLIDGQCYAENAVNPAFPCQRCVSAVSKTSWTGADDAGPSCYIEGECWPAGAGKPNEPCLRCRPTLSTTTWQPSDPNVVTPCNDGLSCTKNDRCNGAQCAGEAYTCDDGLSCTDNTCVGDGTCQYPTRGGTCLIRGACHNDGARESNATCNVCTASASQTRWSPAAAGTQCNDANSCTADDSCNGDSFSCAGEAFSCDDQLTCTADSCNANGTCSNTLSAGFCLINNRCYANGAANPDNPCLVCNGAVPGGWSLAPAHR